MRTTSKVSLTGLLSILLFFIAGKCYSQACVTGGTAHAPVSGTFNSTSITGYRITNPNGPCIHLVGCQNLTITNCILGPSPFRNTNSQEGAGILLENCTNITITDCSFAGNYIGVSVSGGSNIKINNNQFTNVIGGFPRGQYVQLRSVTGAGNEIRDNVGDHVFGARDPQDLINVYMSSGTSSSPILISGNKFRNGSYNDQSGGVLVGDYGGNYITVQNNTLVNTGHFGVGVAGGNHVNVLNNNIYIRKPGTDPSGIYVWGQQGASCSYIDVEGNAVDYDHAFYQGRGYDNRNDSSCGPVVTNNNWDASFGTGILPDRLLCPLLMGYYKFDATWNDVSGSGLNAVPTNGAYAGQGKNAMCANFDGAARYLSLPGSPWLQAQSERLTVSCWIKPWTLQGVQGIAQAQNSDGYNSGWRMVLNGNTFNARLVTDDGAVDIYCGGIVQGNWTHLVMVYDGKSLKGYVNGVLQASAAIDGNVLYNVPNTSAKIGYSNGTSYLNAFLDEFKFYDGSLNDSEILADYNSNYQAVNDPQPEKRLYYPFNNSWLDLSGNGSTAASHSAGFVCNGANSAAASFNGSSYLTIPISPLLDPFSGELSVSCWVKPSTITGIKGIAQSQNGEGYLNGWGMLLLDGVFNGNVLTNQGTASVYCAGIQAGVWNHIVMTYDGLSLKGYVNGVLQGTTPWGGYITYNIATPRQMQIGLCNGGFYYSGYMDEFEFFDGALSASQVLQEYNTVYPLINAIPNCPQSIVPTVVNSTANALASLPGEKGKDYVIWPNPARTEIRISVPKLLTGNRKMLRVGLYNALGQLIKSGYGSGDEVILGVTEFSAGVYYVYIFDERSTIVRKVVIKK
jgi:parallel beta-helix repeat protein